MDGRLRELERRVQGDPDDPVARAELRSALFRLAPLDDRERWAAASPAAQDLVLTTIGRLLGPDHEPLGASVYSAGGARHRIGAWRHAPTRVVLHLVPGGSFRMGSDEFATEQPRRDVAVEPFLIGRYPVRQLEWDRAPQPDERSWTGPELPIEGVTWGAARAWLTAAGLRLPSEAEWEWACRAGTTSHYFWGDAMDDAYCWHDLGAAAWMTHPPAAHDDHPNAFGLVDPSGNVAEWVEDAHGPYASAPRDGSAARHGGALRVLRGGDGFSRASHCRSASRGSAAARDFGAGIGLRAARSLPT